MATETAVEDTATYSPGLDASEVIRTFLQQAVHIGKPEPQASLQVALRNLRKILSIEVEPPIGQVVESGCIAPLVLVITSYEDFPDGTDGIMLAFEAAWSLSNIASGSSEEARAVVEGGAVAPLIRGLQSANGDLQSQCAWALGNLSGDGVPLRDAVLAAGAVGPMCELVDDNELPHSLLRTCVWGLSNLLRGKPAPRLDVAGPAVLSLSKRLVENADQEVVVDALWGLAYISDGTNDQIQVVLDGVASESAVMRERMREEASRRSGGDGGGRGGGGGDDVDDMVLVWGSLVARLKSAPREVRVPLLRLLGNIVSGTDEQTNVIIRAGFLEASLQLLQNLSVRDSSCKELAWALSNIAAGNEAQVEKLVTFSDHALLAAVVNYSVCDHRPVAKECTWVMGNAAMACNSPAIMDALLWACVPQALCRAIPLMERQVASFGVEALTHLVKKVVEMDQSHPIAASSFQRSEFIIQAIHGEEGFLDLLADMSEDGRDGHKAVGLMAAIEKLGEFVQEEQSKVADGSEGDGHRLVAADSAISEGVAKLKLSDAPQPPRSEEEPEEDDEDDEDVAGLL